MSDLQNVLHLKHENLEARHYTFGANESLGLIEIAVASNAAVYSAGTKKIAGTGDTDGFLWKLDAATGEQVWLCKMSATSTGAGSTAVSFRALGVDDQGKVYAAGEAIGDYDEFANKDRSGATNDIALTVWNTDGVKQFSAMWGSDLGVVENVSALGLGGTPLQVFILGQNGRDLTSEGNAASFVLRYSL